MKQYFKLIPAAYVFLIKDGKILLLQRANTGYEDGNWSVPAGHLEGDESATTAMVRETKEEIGLNILQTDLDFAYVLHRKGEQPKGKEGERVDFYFLLKNWKGEPQNMEPDKCSALTWFSLDALPENIIPCVKQALTGYLKGEAYGEEGW